MPGSVTTVTGCPWTIPARAGPSPNVPDVDSTIIEPGLSSPRALARSTMWRAARSLSPPGFTPSSFAQKGPNGSPIRHTGVPPTR